MSRSGICVKVNGEGVYLSLSLMARSHGGGAHERVRGCLGQILLDLAGIGLGAPSVRCPHLCRAPPFGGIGVDRGLGLGWQGLGRGRVGVGSGSEVRARARFSPLAHAVAPLVELAIADASFHLVVGGHSRNATYTKAAEG